ncbi:MAG: hypothetical protein HYW49_10115 [Deltaproteobacteria bacterium]|nr:hypothetical protein [Deltaproteobacteria bacterium]
MRTKNSIALFLAPLILAIFSPSAHAQSKHEVYLNSGTIARSSGDSALTFSPGYGMTLFFPWLQAGANVTVASSKFYDTGTFNFSVLAGPTFNIGGQIENDYFLSPGIAFKTGSASVAGTARQLPTGGVSSTADANGNTYTNPNGVGFGFLIGKRFLIAGKICYRPSVGVVSTGTLGFVINALAGSVHF